MNKRIYDLLVRAIDLLFWAIVGALAGELVHFLGVALAGWHSVFWWGIVAAGAVGGLIFRLQALSRAARESKNPN
jgi:uncharacterized membrane protein